MPGIQNCKTFLLITSLCGITGFAYKASWLQHPLFWLSSACPSVYQSVCSSFSLLGKSACLSVSPDPSVCAHVAVYLFVCRIVCLSIYLLICPSVHSSVHLSISLTICVSVNTNVSSTMMSLSGYLPVCLSVVCRCLSICVFVLSLCLPACLFIHLPSYPCVCLSVCLSTISICLSVCACN